MRRCKGCRRSEGNWALDCYRGGAAGASRKYDRGRRWRAQLVIGKGYSGTRKECAFRPLDKQVGSMGLYIDELERTPEGWRFRTRKIKILKPSEKSE